jgi:hypothetical protein
LAAGTEEVRRLMIHQTGAESMEEETDNFERILQIMKPSREFQSSEIKFAFPFTLHPSRPHWTSVTPLGSS